MGLYSGQLHQTAGSSLDFEQIVGFLNGESSSIDEKVQLGIKKYWKGKIVKHGDWSIHPVFRQMQKLSPLSKFYEIPTYDKNPEKHHFYSQHVSQSLPAIFLGDILNNTLFLEQNKFVKRFNSNDIWIKTLTRDQGQ